VIQAYRVQTRRLRCGLGARDQRSQRSGNLAVRQTAAEYSFDEVLHICLSFRSGIVLERELNLPHARPGRGDRAESCLRLEVRTSPTCGRVAQFDVIGSVKHLHAELKCLFLCDWEILERGDIEINLPRADQVVASTGPEQRYNCVSKGGRIEPSACGWIRNDRVGVAITLSCQLPTSSFTTPRRFNIRCPLPNGKV
jgi:hypothetical protein